MKSLTIAQNQEHVLFDVIAADRSGLFAREMNNPPGVCLVAIAPIASSLSDEEIYGEIKRIVIDPGHGGKDPGAIGPSGLREKDVNLEISRILKGLLEDRLGVEVILTREDDRFITLDERARVANQASADLFLSIHCNAAPKGRRKAGGVETYFLSVAKTDEARAVEARENASIRFELDDRAAYDFDDVSLILWDLAQNEFLKESQKLAEVIQGGLVGSVEIQDRGIDQAGFFVLNGVYMPSVLIECAFISNVEEEAMLKTSQFRRRLAEGILRGVEAFKREQEAKSST
jgi:N-acetylmuramoyl-L-alanine amidase